MSILVLVTSWLLLTVCRADTPDSIFTDIQLTILDGWLTIGIDNADSVLNMNSGNTIVASLEEQEQQATFSDFFWIEDLRWSSRWYTTTVQVTDLTWNIDGVEYKIPAKNVLFKSNDKVLIEWTWNAEVTVNTNNNIENPVTYFQRKKWSTAWILGKYWTKPTLTVTIPASTPATTYKWVITYTLTENVD